MQSRVKQKIGVLKVYAGSLDVCNRFLWIAASYRPAPAAATRMGAMEREGVGRSLT